MSLQIVEAEAARVVTLDEHERRDVVAYMVSNLLVGNPMEHPVLEVRGAVAFKPLKRVLMAVTGEASIKINGSAFQAWRALPVPEGAEAVVRALSPPAYVAFKGLEAPPDGVKPGTLVKASELDGVESDLMARRVPATLLRECMASATQSSWRSIVEKIARHIELACEMARTGAKLIKVKIGHDVYELWIKELR